MKGLTALMLTLAASQALAHGLNLPPRERLARINKEFPYSEALVKDQLARLLPDLKEGEFERLKAQGLLESMQLEGQSRYFVRAVDNLFYIAPQYRQRRQPYSAKYGTLAPLYQPHPHLARLMAGQSDPKRFEITHRIKVDADVVPAGESLKFWIPYPRLIPGQQDSIELLEASPGATVGEEGDLQRSLYVTAQAQAGKATEVFVRYRYRHLGRYQKVDPAKVTATPADPALAPYLAPRVPHVQFTPELTALSQRLLAGETNPYRQAQRLFAAVAAIPWAGARDYSTIANISQYAASAGHADCGQKTLLLITLLRLAGIPARWQSGWEFSDASFDTMHDWGQLYLAPYGWLPFDATHGLLGEEGDPQHGFYLGGLDSYRLVFNDDYSQPLVPARQWPRSDTVDAQRGEVEWRGGNLYYDQWQYQLDWQEIKTP
ncbi:transglutaminase-like domain-containing protein [Gallaecimonas xiamenensis]|uniref:Transglutaminase n=1 Tax=Gallaecimonas xiamenensis 3-C-1 TaxID=745411 RepID=K2J3K8_9GAMM|nr:transglutaminase-like domain-containing protein [Gallaecimonas xiamenensis]EKE77586.1 transglutaminase [Gallaecimonas xiamenensis 3-C-1]